jgi:hypothetical protein
MRANITPVVVTLLACCAPLPALAVGVHKWIDAEGVTHYSDEAPEAIETTLIDLPDPASGQTGGDAGEADYYSISRQWERMNRERLEREKLELERAKIAAASQPPPSTIYVENSGADRIIPVYGDFRYRKPYRYRKHYRTYRQPALNRPAAAAEISGGFPTR